MPLVRHNRIERDEWRALPSDGIAPDIGDIVVSLERWHGDRHLLLNRKGRLGIELRSDDDPAPLQHDLRHFSLIVLHYTSFVDGRHYSNAKLLRDRYGFTGELRASGELLRDQLFYLNRCGFDAYLLDDSADIDDFLHGLDDFSLCYQGAVDSVKPIRRLRAAARSST